MLDASRERLLREVPDNALVLDIGGWAKPLPRADYVLDLMPYETRGQYGAESSDPERFTADTWIRHDICAREPFPFEDGRFDFVVCAHTLEDIRDPVWVCSEMMRVAQGGYIETPSRLEEQCYGVQGPWVGWSHHRWLVETGPASIEFVQKYHMMNGRDFDRFPAEFLQTLTPEERVAQLWWEGSFEFGERYLMTPPEIDEYVAEFVARELRARGFDREAAPGRRRWWR